MSSQQFDRGRRPRLEGMTSHEIQTSRIPAFHSSATPSSAAPRSQISKPLSLFYRGRHGSSASENEEAHPQDKYTTAGRSRAPSREDERRSGLPRRSTASTRSLSRDATSTASSIPPPMPSQSKIAGPQSTPSYGAERPRNVLRRKAPSIEQYTERSRARSDPSKAEPNRYGSPQLPSAARSTQYRRGSGSVNLQPNTSTQSSQPQGRRPSATADAVIERPTFKADETKSSHFPKELASLAMAVNTANLPPPTPNFTSTSSPSTRYSDSPGPWSSRTSTPTSMSSYSPGIVHPAKLSSLRQPSPSLTKHPTTRPATGPIPRNDNDKDKLVRPRLPRKAQTHPPVTAPTSARIEYLNTQDRMRTTASVCSPPTRKSSIKARSPTKNTPKERYDKPRDLKGIISEEQSGHIEHHRGNDGDVSQLATAVSATPPLRPSRAGTDHLELKPSPVIQSNLTSLKAPGHRRRGSNGISRSPEPRRNPVYPVSSSTESFQSKSSTQITSRIPEPSSGSASRQKTVLVKEPKVSMDHKEKGEQGRSTAGKRFGMFSRKAKAAGDEDKTTKRGPAAGTGHEGYGKYAQRGRRPSVGSSTGRTRSTSTSASTSNSSILSRVEPEMDDFLLNRLEPVIINGGGMDGATLSRTLSEQSGSSVSVASTSYSMNPQNMQFPGYSSESLVSPNRRYVQSPESVLSPQRDMNVQKHEQNQGSDLPRRRSVRRSQISGGKRLTLFPAPISTNIPTSRPSIDSSNTSQTSISQASIPVSTRDGLLPGVKEPKPKKPEKRSRWNFFQRSHHAPRMEPNAAASSKPVAEVSVSVSKLPTSKPVAHYALLDSDQIDTDSLEDILHQVEDSPPTEEEKKPREAPVGLGLKRQHIQSILLPSPPTALTEFSSEMRRPSSPKVFFNRDPLAEEPAPQAPERRTYRLTSVGRIPPVVSKREGQHKPAMQSFSRPFSRVEAPSLTATADSFPSNLHRAGRPIVGAQTDVLPSRDFYPGYSGNNFIPGVNNASYQGLPQEFLAFSPRKGSEVSGSSSSESRVSLAAVTAVVPAPGSGPTEDEVWNEYDDLIDDVLSPSATKKKAKPLSREDSFKMATLASKALQAELDGHKSDANISNPSELPSIRQPTSPVRSSASSVRLRRSMIQSALHSSFAPSTPMSFSDFFAGYEERNKDSMELKDQDLLLSLRRDEVQPHASNDHTSANGHDRRRNTLLLEMAERDRHGSTAQTNLRSSSLMTSRWLSFGRVLFSPAHNHLQSEDQGRILVVDGLGNDDWSYYCSLSYPNATVYSLSLSPPSISTNPAAWSPPTNHRIIHHTNLENPFPFPKGFFTVAIFRFPAACSEEGLRNCISECKRVLRAGGYLELSVIDLDMVNMGNRTRKAVRMLKERMYMADSSVSLKPAGDNIQRLLGKRGFQNLNRCVVGVPVAGTVIRSSDTSSSNQSTAGPTPTVSDPPHSALSSNDDRRNKRPISDDANASLGDLLSDPSPSASKDESIAKIVAKVARWWYTRCHETWILPEGNPDHSIWADRRVLRECQRRGTGFRLLIAYAQKPSEMPRRTVSV
ncbi:hypothetical protein AJ80_04253 [Polytolypa hystricis UAMH7299]|uniref:Methyltransferase type 11 domain-containing protein n=1 Tax=Polytolypa hystricis (strain UAMH7299) TaxID=1447883 RepID=A0A2B7YBL2_POLH7|nr:hypothetical protein AJ80_04253 [Polytolypa hystricis UAMH7299]